MLRPMIRSPEPDPPRIAPPMLIETRLYTDRVVGNDPEATTDTYSREELAHIVEELRSPNRVARDVLRYTWPHARVRRTEVVLERRGFRKRWRQNRDAAVAGGDVQTALLATMLVDAIDRMVPESLVICLCEIDGATWELFVDVTDESLIGCRVRKDIW